MKELVADESAFNAIPGARYDARRQWFLPQGLVARDLPRHPMFPRPKKNASGKSYAVSFDELGGNTLLGMHMSRILAGGHNRGHRHLDEALILIVSGTGYSELRQSEDAPMQRVEWRPGSVLAIPSNAWHQHFNTGDEIPARQLAFKDTQFLRRVFASRSFVYDNPFRFDDRYADEPDYWTSREDRSGITFTNRIVDPLAETLLPAGEGISTRTYEMGGHRNLQPTIVELEPGARTLPDRSEIVESAWFVLAGSGHTVIRGDDGVEVRVEWSNGDLFCPPLGHWSQHVAGGSEPVRLLAVRNLAIQHALADGPDSPARLSDLIEPDYSATDLSILDVITSPEHHAQGKKGDKQ